MIAKKGLLPVIEINLDLVDNEVRFQPQVSDRPRKASATLGACQNNDDENVSACVLVLPRAQLLAL